MRHITLTAVIAGLFVMVHGDTAYPRSAIKDFEHSLHNLERNLCKSIPSSKCKVRKHKAGKAPPAAKPALQKPDTTAQKPSPPPPEPKPESKSPVVPVVPATPTSEVPKPTPKPDKLSVPVPPVKPPVPPPAHPATKAVNPPPLPKPAPPPPKPAPQIAPEPKLPPIVAPPPLPKPAPQQATPTEPTPAPAPPADATSDSCLQALNATGATFSPVPQPDTSEQCQIQSPVRVVALKTAAGMVKLPDKPIFNCAFAAKLEDFVANRAQPLALSGTSGAIVAMGTGPGFDCRGRNGDSSARLSEHAKGNAVDIVYFNFANKTGVLVKDALNEEASGFAFLRDVRAAACKEFNTVLGPGANSAHAEHFHLDLEPRNGGYKICE